MTDAVAVLTLLLTVLVLALLIPFALHRAHLVWLSRRPVPRIAPWLDTDEPAGDEAWPTVTIQLPIYNELHVVERLIDAAATADYPADRIEIQVLDDSTDETVERARERVAHWCARGVAIQHIRRPDRAGFKAGALAYGLERSNGEFILVLDADFVMPPDLPKRLLGPFRDAGIGAVQARWDYLNRDESWLTRAQAMLLDGHFCFEQGGRYAGGRFFNFNGTAGMWRRSCIEDAGGWRSDTLTEDLDLSYRAQLSGWRFAYLDEVGVPSELPGRVGALEVQQKRWAQGGVQTARKILPSLFRSPLPTVIKAEAAVHLWGHLAHPLTLILGLLLLPSALARIHLGLGAFLWLDLLVFAMATSPFLLFYGAAGRQRGRRWRDVAVDVVRTLAVGIGLSVPVSRAVWRGVTGRDDPFLRTPKAGSVLNVIYRRESGLLDTVLKLLLAGVMAAYVVLALQRGILGTVPFILLFGSGYLAMGLAGLRLRTRRRTVPELHSLQPDHEPDGNPEEESGPEGLHPEVRPLVRA